MDKMENYDLVQKGFRTLLVSLSGYIGKELNSEYGNEWWSEVKSALSEQWDLPEGGEYGELIDSLDIANCIRIIDRKWVDVFSHRLSLNCRTWSKELMGHRNIVAHHGQQDLEQRLAERALDTMCLLCEEIDAESAEEIKEYYLEVRSRADGDNTAYSGITQPLIGLHNGENGMGLLDKIGTELVEKTNLTRKVTYGGKTLVYPVYRVRLDALFYNDQNDRISTWITEYEAENGKGSLEELPIEIYNRIIENFIFESNEEDIKKTQKNIMTTMQRVSGVTLADGRIVDGNRRFTCLRRIQRETKEPVYFETVIMDADIKADKKQIKLLELAIQHGEESKVDYDNIDYAIGTYRDVVQTGLITVEEYAKSAEETVAAVRKRINIATLINEFLEYIRLPEQYHVAREFQIYSIMQEMMSQFSKLKDEEIKQLKTITFTNALMGVFIDQRKFIRDIKSLIKSNTYSEYFDEQTKTCEEIADKYKDVEVHSKKDIEHFSAENKMLGKKLEVSLNKAMKTSRSKQLKDKPSEKVSKCMDLLMEIDSRLFNQLNEDEKNVLKNDLAELGKMVKSFEEML